MVEYLVSLRVFTEQSSLQELAIHLGPYCEGTSYTMGTDESGHYDRTMWEVESPLGEEAQLDEHIEALLAQFDLNLLQKDGLPGDRDVHFVIGAFFNDAECNLDFEPDFLKRMGEFNIRLDTCCYPCHFEEEAI